MMGAVVNSVPGYKLQQLLKLPIKHAEGICVHRLIVRSEKEIEMIKEIVPEALPDFVHSSKYQIFVFIEV